ncbi:VOC family protein [Salipiger bermudensis]|uniref:VOC family protein n=1 Tax=Salipiger bermudensis TaxID=344736 RepID=UPI001CD7A123|nr:VOC family protein [Salipiger bermudensis]MCA0964758.1 VOC family protein [Salipiger bermudensis]
MTTRANLSPAGITSASAPLRIGTVALTVRDLSQMTEFYRDAIGLELVEARPGLSRLGTGGEALLELIHNPAARLADRTETGLFHVAFLLQDRASLGHWLRHAAETGVRLLGASDHLVSEALYLADPEGNGIEIYRDRPSEDWSWADDEVDMATIRLDLDALAADAPDEPWGGMQAGTVVGHVHLQVGDVKKADEFYTGLLGLDVTSRVRGAAFYSAGGYHHHIAANTWNSAGAGPRPTGMTGLHSVEIVAADPELHARLAARAGEQPGDSSLFTDPWGTVLRLRAA